MGSLYDSTVLALNPVGYWKLDELSGATAHDSSGTGNDGAIVAGPTLGVNAPIVGDPYGISFDASNTQYINIANNASQQPGDTFTLEFWIDPSLSGFHGILDTGVGGFQVTISAGTVTLLKNGTGGIASSAVTASVGIWTLCEITKNGTATHIYFNGVDVTVLLTNHTIVTTGSTIAIGAVQPAPHFCFPGSMTRIAIYNFALTPVQALANYTASFGDADTVVGQTTLASTLISRVLTDLQQDSTNPAYWSRQEILDIIWEGLVEMNLMTGYRQISVSRSLTLNALQDSPPHIAITHIRIVNSALLKYTVDDLDSQYPNWEDDSSAAQPRRWAPVGTNLFVVHPRSTVGRVATIDVLQLPAILTESDIIPLDDEYMEALEKYVFHVARLKEGGPEFQQSLGTYQEFTEYTANLADRIGWKAAPLWAYAPIVKLADAVPRPRTTKQR